MFVTNFKTLQNNFKWCLEIKKKIYSVSTITRNIPSLSTQRNYSNKNILKLAQRGLFVEIFPDDSNALAELLIQKPQSVYAGFDPTADSLHLGNLLVILALIHCQRAGHHIIALIGDSTALIGDPSGRSKERVKLGELDVSNNSVSIRLQLQKIFDNHEKYYWNKLAKLNPISIVNNSNWYGRLGVLDFLCSVGVKLRMGDMLSRSSVKSRLDSSEGMNFAEFAYQSFQAYDWLYLCKKYNCLIQIGGLDQKGNIMTGYDLLSKTFHKESYGLFLPLITSESGDKFGKTGSQAIWLNEIKTTVFDFYQFLVRTKDNEIERLLKLLTFLDVEDIQNIIQKHKVNPEKRYAQKKLADYVTLLVHGADNLNNVKNVTKVLYDQNIESLCHLSQQELFIIFQHAPISYLSFEYGITMLELSLRANCFKGSEEAYRIISRGGFYVNNNCVRSPDYVVVESEHILPNKLTLIRVGKKNYHIVKWN